MKIKEVLDDLVTADKELFLLMFIIVCVFELAIFGLLSLIL